MKRFFFNLLIALTIFSTIGTAQATSKRKSTRKPQPQVLEQEAGGPAVRAMNIKPEKKQSDPGGDVVAKPGPMAFSHPVERQLTKAGSKRFDLRSLPQTRPIELERAELEDPTFHPVTVQSTLVPPSTNTPSVPRSAAPAPAATAVYEGLDRFNWGAGSPPDTNGDVGPNNYIQTVNTSVGVYRKSDGFQQAAFTFNTFMSQGNFGNLCDTNNFGDPVVLYDTFEDRWIITDFAFLTDASGNVLAPAYQCFAASMTNDPVAGGWNFYSIKITDALNDYEKFGIWPDGLYMSANMFSFGAGSSFKNARAWAFNKAQMYAGSPTVKVVTFDIGGGDFAVMPSNARLQTGTPPAGRPNLFLSTWQFTNALTVYKFHVDWNSIGLSTFTGPDTPLSATSWPNAAVANAAQPGTSQLIDVLQIRAMVQNQYTNFGGTESLWIPHTIRRFNTSGFAAPRWYQADVTGGTVAANLVQAATWDPDGANTTHRFMPSLALDRAGNMAMGYSASNSTTLFPSIMYAGRLAADPINTFSLTEQTMFAGTASQLSSSRWGDYSGMALDPDGCRFWYTSEYATGLDTPPVPPATSSPGFNQRWRTKFGVIPAFPGCTPVGAGGTVSGTVTVTPGGTAIAGATVMLGSRSTTTDGSGNYSFTSIPAGTYPSMTASKPGFGTASASSIVVTDGGTTTQNFALTAAPASACLTDTTQADFLTGVPSTTVDLNATPDAITLSNAPASDQVNTAGTSTGTGFGTPAWCGQTFIPAVTGVLAKADVQLFCNGCGATPPNLTLSVRNTAAGLPTGADLATATIPGSAFASGGTVLFTATFGSPVTLTSGTQYVLVLRPVSAPAGSGYFWIRSSPSTYANGSRVLSADSGGTWSTDTTRDYNFRTYMQTGYSASGNFVSSPKDSNPLGGTTSIWSTFSWTATTPANTSLKFQLAGSNNVNGPFNFVGPDGTAATFFTTSPVQLSPQFYNFRYLEYNALFATTNGAVTPTLNDATACFNDVNCSSTVATITPTPAQVCSNVVGNTASGPAGMTSYAWGIANGTITSATNIQSITYTAGASGAVTLNLTVTAPNGCIVSGSTNVTINPIPSTPTITPGGPTTFCAGGSVTLSSSSASGNQWSLNGNPIGGATNQTYSATASGNYTVTVTTSGCSSAASSATVVTVNPLPATPTITPGGPTTFCTGGSVTLTSSAASGNQWFLNGNPIGGATNATYSATASGSYTVKTTNGNGCTSSASAATVVTVNPNPNATITAPATVVTNSTGNAASVANAGVGATYAWSITGGTITAGAGTANITFTAAAGVGTTTLNVTVTTSAGCTDSKSANINRVPPTVTVTSVVPNFGTVTGGTNVTINGTGFASGATVSFGGTAATNVVVVTSIKITAKTPAHAAGAVNVTVTNTDTGTGTLVNGFQYNPQSFDPNGDNTIDPSDIFYLINYLFMGGPAPHGPGGVLSGDANGDGVVDPADVFYLINYLFLGGQKPNTPAALPTMRPTTTAVASASTLSGSLSLGKPVLNAGRYVVPVILTASPDSIAPQAMSLRIHFASDAAVGEVSVRRAGAANDSGAALFEFDKRSGNDVSYVVAYDPTHGGLNLGASRSVVVAEIEVEASNARVAISIDPKLTMLSNQSGTVSATTSNGKLKVSGTSIGGQQTAPRPRTPGHEVN